MKQHKIRLILFLNLFVLSLLLVFNYISYLSVKTKSDLTDSDYQAVASEFDLNISQTEIAYIYSQGSERYGIKLFLSQYSSACIEKILNTDLDVNKLQNYLSDNSWYEYKTSAGNSVSSKVISFCFLSESSENLSAYVFEENGIYYMEIEKNTTDNISVFQ